MKLPRKSYNNGTTVWCKFHNHNFNRFIRHTRVTDRRRDRRTGDSM